MKLRSASVLVLGLLAACQAAGPPPEETSATSRPITATTSPPTACSARGLYSVPRSQEGLPEAVAETRQEIVAAASRCDYDRLAELTPPEFTYSFGDGADPAAYWREQEELGNQPLRFLAEMLERPYATRDGRYLWPSAFVYDDWADVPEEDREALRPLYDQDDFADFERFGAYLGYRVGIDEDGTWRFFAAGD